MLSNISSISIEGFGHFRVQPWIPLLPRVWQSLRAAFEQLAPELALRRLSPITFDEGNATNMIDLYRPDTACIVPRGNLAPSPNRAPGDLKVSWIWESDMHQQNARYSYILTNLEFVAVKRFSTA